MKTLIQITGVQYACTEADIPAVMAAMERQKPEVLLVTEQTHDFGIIVRALIGTAYRGVVSRFDLEPVLRTMHHSGTSVLVGQVVETDPEGQCYNICISGDDSTLSDATDNTPDIWAEWHWTGAPILDSSLDDSRLDISIKVALAELQRNGSMNRQTLLEHLNLILQLARWDVSRETQQQLSQIRRLVGHHSDPDVRTLVPQLRRTLTGMGGKKRTKEFQDIYLPQLCNSAAAERMFQQWCAIHKGELSNVEEWQATIRRQLESIETCLMKLPADLFYQKDQFGALMHRLLYLNIPRCKLLMLLSAIVLRRLLRKQMGLPEEEATENEEEKERRLTLQLAPIFNNNIDKVREFLLLAKGQKPTDIIRLVNLWVKEKYILSTHCHRPLWQILHEAEIYKPTETNWNLQLDIRKSWR